MNKLITVDFDTQTVSARELHKQVGSTERFSSWFERQLQFGFVENEDYTTVKVLTEVQNNGGIQQRELIDHNLSIDMAKQICMVQKNEKARAVRQYLIDLEKAWNTPEQVMARALKIAQTELDSLKLTVAVQNQQIAELNPKATYYDLVLQCPDLISTTLIAKDYGRSARWLNKLLAENKIQFQQRGVWLLYDKYARQGYTSTKKDLFVDSTGKQHTKAHTYWTQKGRLFLYDFLKQKGYLPIVEQQ